MPELTTASRGYPLPHPLNSLSVDVLRIIQALTDIDADIVDLLENKAAEQDVVYKIGAQSIDGVKTFTSSPVVPTATAGDNTTKAATTAFVQAAIASLVASSPAALDTLNELAAALGNDANFAATITGLLAAKAPIESPALTGTPTAPTAAGGTNTAQVATTAFVTAGLAGKVNSADLPAAITAGNVKLTGDILQRLSTQVSGQVSLPTVIPADNTIPQNTEGTQVLTLTITPTSASSVIVVDVDFFASELTNVGDLIIGALFRDTTADAVAVGVIGSMNGGGNHLTSGVGIIRYSFTAGTTSPITLNLHVGNNTGAATLNVTHTNATFGNLIASTMRVTEYKA